MKLKYNPLNDALCCYIGEHHSRAHDPVLDDLRRETEALGEIARMQIGEEQGSLMTLLAAAIGARTAIEVGTFTGYSSICIARGLPDDGRLLCLDASEEWTAIARRYWARAEVADKIELRLGAAIPALERLEPEWEFDFAFIDAAKTEYDGYYELVLPRVRPNGLILFDNMLSGGRVIETETADADARAIDALNRKLAQDPRVECVLLAVADGIQMCRKR